jgi:hypothetical protein
MKTIKYEKKITNANTIYVDMHPTDRTWLLNEIQKVSMGFTQDLITYEYLLKKTGKITKGRNGQNSPKEYLNGVYSNLCSNDNDFSIIQLKDIEHIFSEINSLYGYMLDVLPESVANWESFEPVKFKDIKDLDKKIVEPSVNVIEEALVEFEKTHVSDLFEITITVKTK